MSLNTTPAMAVGRGPRKQHRQDAAARGADKDRGRRRARDQHSQEVCELDRGRVVGGIAIVFGQPPTTIIEREHAPWRLGIGRKCGRQGVKVSRRARETGKADHRQKIAAARAVFADVQP